MKTRGKSQREKIDAAPVLDQFSRNLVEKFLRFGHYEQLNADIIRE
jgi:hypothetical protein